MPDTKPSPIVLKDNHGTPRERLRNDSASLHDLGDGVLGLEFHSKGNTLDALIYELGHAALDQLEGEDAFRAMVIGSQAKDFSLGANINVFLQTARAAQGDLEPLERVVGDLQALLMRVRFSSKPVVVAPYGRVLGGGAEVVMAGAKVVTPATTRIGLVEIGVGVIPAGGGCKELLRRVVSPRVANGPADISLPLQAIFEAIVLAQISDGAQAAQQSGFLAPTDRIVASADGLIDTAKQEAIDLVEAGYTPPNRADQTIWAAGRAGKTMLQGRIDQWRVDGRITDYDAEIAANVAHVLCGGEREAAWVSEDDLLALERRAFAECLSQPQTQARIAHMLQFAKPLRN